MLLLPCSPCCTGETLIDVGGSCQPCRYIPSVLNLSTGSYHYQCPANACYSNEHYVFPDATLTFINDPTPIFGYDPGWRNGWVGTAVKDGLNYDPGPPATCTTGGDISTQYYWMRCEAGILTLHGLGNVYSFATGSPIMTVSCSPFSITINDSNFCYDPVSMTYFSDPISFTLTA